MTPPEHTSYGFQEVPIDEKTGRVRHVFARVANKYDVMNDLMSAGLHRPWKDAMVARAAPRPGEVIIDMAGGTGDISHRLHDAIERQRSRRGGEPAQIFVCDINADMLMAGVRQDTLTPYATLPRVQVNAEALGFGDASADLYTIAFGIRNVTHRAKALAEAWRVLKPGGRFVCLEFSEAHPSLRALYDRYSFAVVPKLGQLVTGDAEPYQYLVESIRRFPNAPTFEQELKDAGFERTGFRRLSAGVVALHWGTKPKSGAAAQ